ncbi:hypothetical protein [Clostridium botulinum]|uniref:hypothetical protein n=1 Tax=Clostridium botulinum TaxID=1491 RepID=UPI0009AF6D94|nr:hypothetical protein [Clostridium botulinum]
MKFILFILIAFMAILLLLLIIGLLLPKDRIAKRVVTFSSDINTVWDVVTNNEDYDWRSDISKIEILDNGDSWIEYALNGSHINFDILKKNDCKEYDFNMNNKMFTGKFTSRFEKSATENAKVEFVESISIKNPILKPISYLFFDIQGFQDTYISDLKKKLNE